MFTLELGAVGASALWLFGHRLWGWGLIALLLNFASLLAYYGPLYLLLPGCGLLLSLLLGAQGGALAWQHGKSSPLNAYLSAEARWKWVGLASLPMKLFALCALIAAALKHG